MPFIPPSSPLWSSLLEEAPHDLYHLPGYAELDAEMLGGEALGWYYEKSGLKCLIPLIKRKIPRDLMGGMELYDLVSPHGYPGMLCNKKIGAKRAHGVLSVFVKEAKEERYVSSFVRLNSFMNNWDLEPLVWPAGRSLPLDSSEVYEKAFSRSMFSGEKGWTVRDFSQMNLARKMPVYDPVTYGHTVALDLKQKQGTGYSENHRRNLKHLHSKGYHALVNDWQHLPAFIEAYHQTMHRRKAKAYYFFPASYFNRLKDIAGDRLMLVSVVSPEGKFVSGGLYTLFHGIMQFHLGGTFDEAVGLSPSKLVMDKAIETGRQLNAKWLHLGGGVGAVSGDGLFRFKKGFAGEKLPYTCLQIIHHYDYYVYLCRKVGKEYHNGDTSYFPLYRM